VFIGDLKTSPNSTVFLPVKIFAEGSLRLVQLTLEYDPMVISPSHPFFKIDESDTSKQINLINRNLPFGPISGDKSANILVQLSCSQVEDVYEDSLSILFKFYVNDSMGSVSCVTLDSSFTHSFVVTSDLDLFAGEDLQIRNGMISIEDLEAPTAFDLVSPPDSSWMSAVLPKFRWTSSSDITSGLESYRLFLNDSLNRILPPTITTTQPDEPLSDGVYQWWVEAVDSSQRSRRSNQTWHFFVDKTGPCAKIIYPSHNDSLQTDSLTIQILAADSLSFPASGVESVDVSFDQGHSWHSARQSESPNDIWIFHWTNIEKGTYFLNCRATDHLGNSRECDKTVRVIFGDFTQPLPFNLVSPREKEWLNTSFPIFFWQEAVGADYYRLFINNKLIENNITDSTIIQLVDPLSDGTYTWYVRAFDSAGNYCQSLQQHTFYIDTTPPKTLITYPYVGFSFSKWDGRIEGTATDFDGSFSGIGVERVLVSIDSGKTWYDTNALEKGFSKWHYDFNEKSYPDLNIMSKGIDSLGNEESPGPPIHIITSILTKFDIPKDFKVFSPYPNPYYVSNRLGKPITIHFQLPKTNLIKLIVYNIRGQEVYRVTKQFAPGYHNFYWEARSMTGLSLPCGLYFIRIQLSNRIILKKVLLLP